MLQNWITFLSAAFMAIYLGLMLIFVGVVARKKKEQFEVFATTLTRGLETARIANLQDCVDVARGISGQIDDGVLGARLAQWLRKYLVRIVSDQISVSQSFKASTAKDKVSAYLRELEKRDPYAQLPQAERGIVTDIIRLIDQDDKSLAKSKTHDLAGLVEARNEHVLKLERTNRWSLPLAIIGVLLTILFGLISLK